jgi:thiol-disulfide isomerase/thioredoxin
VGGTDSDPVTDTGLGVTEDTGTDPVTDTGGHIETAETGDSAPPIDSALFGVDSDGDGLSDGLEMQLGWNPEDPDTDGDGFDDREEYEAGTDGAVAWSWPLDGCRWPELHAQAVTLVGDQETGWNDHDVVPDLKWIDQCGGEVSPWQFPGHVIVLDMAATWCGPCQESAAMLQSIFASYRDRGFVLLTALQGALLEEGQDWASAYGSSHPVSGDVDSVLAEQLAERSTIYPTYVLVDANLKVRSVKSGEAEQSWFDRNVPGLQDERDAALE